jgi:alkylation response protein AidB-like acyl-CoA dehydrogenase
MPRIAVIPDDPLTDPAIWPLFGAATMPPVTSNPSVHGSVRLTEEQILLRDAVRVLADDQVAPRAAEIDRVGEWPEDMRRLLADHDILAIPFAERHGGLGGDLLTLCLAIEQVSRHCATTGLILAVQALGAIPIQVAGTDEQQDRWLPGLASGERLVAFALTEADAGSDPSGIRTRAVRDGDEYVISGSKRFISQGSVADLVIVFAVTNPEADKPSHRLSAFVVESDRPGFTVARLEHKMGIRGSPTAELAFDGVRVPVTHRLGDEGQGFAIAMQTFERSRPGIAAQAVGIAQGALEVAAAYAMERRQFGKPIGDLQMIQAMLADMDAATESARQLLYTACVEIEAGSPDAARWAAICKLVAGDAAMRVTTDAVQVLGGYGYVEEYPVERMMRDAKITQLYEGTQQIQRLIVARALLARHP